MNTIPIVVEQIFETDSEAVWNAITDPEQMRQWFFGTMDDFRPEVGFDTEFDVECDGKIYRHLWKVTEVVQNKRIVYDWEYQGYSGFSSVEWELTEADDKTKLSLTHIGQESFPQNDPAFKRESCQAGWEYFVCDRLVDFLQRHSA